MRSFSLLTLAILLAAPLALLAPVASADPWCFEGDSDCPRGMLFCTYSPQVCVWDPCATTHCLGAGTSATPAAPDLAECYRLAHGPGFDNFLCYDVKGPVGCKVYTETYRWDAGWSRNCIA